MNNRTARNKNKPFDHRLERICVGCGNFKSVFVPKCITCGSTETHGDRFRRESKLKGEKG